MDRKIKSVILFWIFSDQLILFFLKKFFYWNIIFLWEFNQKNKNKKIMDDKKDGKDEDVAKLCKEN